MHNISKDYHPDKLAVLQCGQLGANGLAVDFWMLTSARPVIRCGAGTSGHTD